MKTAERLFAERGIEAVSLREIQKAAKQSNTSVVTYHFGSKAGLVRQLIEWRRPGLAERRAALEAEFSKDPDFDWDHHAAIWLLVRPFADSIAAGEMFVPFMARLAEDPRATTDYRPEVDDWSEKVIDSLINDALRHLPPRLRRGRAFQLVNSVLNLLGSQAQIQQPISEAQLHNYVDAWAYMLKAPVSESTWVLLGDISAAEEEEPLPARSQ